MSHLDYLDDESFDLIDRPVARRNGLLQTLPGQSQDGYGSKITTDRMVKLKETGKEYRVYATCYSNAASHWVTIDGKKLFLRG